VNTKMKIELEVEKILKEQGIAPPAMNEEEFMRRLEEKLLAALPEEFAEVVRTAASEIVAEERKRLGREAPCKFHQAPEKCAKGLDTGQCLECLSYKPKREWGEWFQNLYRAAPERFEWAIIVMGTLSLVLAIVFPPPELRFWVVIIWFVLFIQARLSVIFQWKLVRQLNRNRGIKLRWLK